MPQTGDVLPRLGDDGAAERRVGHWIPWWSADSNEVRGRAVDPRVLDAGGRAGGRSADEHHVGSAERSRPRDRAVAAAVGARHRERQDDRAVVATAGGLRRPPIDRYIVWRATGS